MSIRFQRAQHLFAKSILEGSHWLGRVFTHVDLDRLWIGVWEWLLN